MRRFSAFMMVAVVAVGAAAAAQQPAETAAPAPATAVTPTQAAQGQQPSKGPNGTYTLTANARLVVLDVVVNDAKGHVVTDLTRDEFQVTEAGDPQTLYSFEAASSHIPPADVTINSTADLDRVAPRAPVNIILLDEFNTRFEDEAFARYSLKKYLEKQPDKLVTPTILIAVSIDKFEVLHDYTQDKQAVIAALDHHFVANPWRNTSNSWAAERLGTAFLTLRRVAEATIGHLGHKNMIWIGRGFPALNMRNVAVDQQNRVESEVQRCVNALRDARITLTTIDPAGLLVDQFAYGSAAAFNDPFGGNYQFAKLARATGGRTIYGRNDVDAQITAAATDGSSFYTLVYRPTSSSNNPREFRRIVVKLDRPGLTVTTREGYYPPQRVQRVNPQDPGRRLMSDLISAESSTMAYDGVDFTLTPSTTDGSAYRVFVQARSLAWSYATDTEPRHTDMILLVSTFDKKGKELSREAKNIVVKAPTTVPPTGRLERPVMLDYALKPDAKAVRARFVVRIGASGRIGTVDEDLAHPVVVSSASSRPVPKPAAAPTSAPAPASVPQTSPSPDVPTTTTGTTPPPTL